MTVAEERQPTARRARQTAPASLRSDERFGMSSRVAIKRTESTLKTTVPTCIIATVVFPFTNVRLCEEKPRNPAYPEHLRTIGDHIRKRRLDLGLSQPAVAKHLKVGRCSLAEWELGVHEPRFRYGPAIYAFLGYVPFPIGDTLSEQLKAYRWLQGLTIKQAARVLGINTATWLRWESSGFYPTRRALKKRVAQLLETLLVTADE